MFNTVHRPALAITRIKIEMAHISLDTNTAIKSQTTVNTNLKIDHLQLFAFTRCIPVNTNILFGVAQKFEKYYVFFGMTLGVR